MRSNGIVQQTDVVTLGESLMLFTSPPDTMLLQSGAGIRASFVGAESNLAIGLARLGHGARWLSVLGNDLFGDHILKSLRGEGVDVSRVVRSDAGPTAVLFKNRRPAAEPEIFYYRANSAMGRASARTFASESWHGAEILYLTGITAALSDGCRELVEHVIADAKEHGLRVVFDPNHRRKLWSEEQARNAILPWLPHIDLLLAGDSEARMLSGGATDVRPMAAALLDGGVREVVIKLGRHGAWHFAPDEEHFAQAFDVPHVVDPIGAGDAFAAGYLSAELEGLSIPDRLTRGHALGAIVCQTDGDWEGLPTRAQLDAYLFGQSESAR